MVERGSPGVRIPLQVGTSAIAYASGTTAALPCGLLSLAGAIASGSSGSTGGAIALGAIAAVMFAYSVSASRRAWRTRASDLAIHASGLLVQGGARRGRAVTWAELRAPFATVSTSHESRLELAWLLVGFPASALFSWFDEFSRAEAVRTLRVTRLTLHLCQGDDLLLAETDDPHEAASLEAARDTISSVAEGRSFVEQAPAHPAKVVVCAGCGAPAVPSEELTSPCSHCGAPVPMPDDVRRMAASARASAAARVESHRLVTKLLEQPSAASVDFRLSLLTAVQLAVWPIGWVAPAARATTVGWSSAEIPFLLSPSLAVLAGFLLALSTASERRALGALTLGFGALAPRRDCEAARCRRCHGPLAAAAGVTTCGHCGADNVVGIDLRAAVDETRAEQTTFDRVLDKRRQARGSAIGLRIVAALLALIWLVATVAHVASAQ